MCTCHPDWLDGSMAGYVERPRPISAPRAAQSLDELAGRYRELEAKASAGLDAETATAGPVPNETVAAACRITGRLHRPGFCGPAQGTDAVAEVANIASLGLRGVKFHPSLQAFAPDDPAYWPIFAACERHACWPVHTGTSGIGARQPGGQGIRIDLAHPSNSTGGRRPPDLTWWPRISAGPGNRT